MDATSDLLTVALLPGSGPRLVQALARRGLRDVIAHPGEHEDLLSADAVSALRSGAAGRAAEAEETAARRLGLVLTGWDEPAYPALLRRTFDPPPVLYVRGRLDPADEGAAVAVVGARAASAEGVELARGLARTLAAVYGATVVSGLARGIDTAAHRGALDGAGRTVAVLGSALDRLYPPENDRLAARIAERGAVVSEFPLGTAPLPGHFPRRNRVIAGWSRAVVVVEATHKSGALGTARHALDAGREVMAVPGHPLRALAEGTNALIRDGAALVRDARDVAFELALPARPTAAPAPAPDAVLDLLRTGEPVTLGEIQERSGLETPALLARLTDLELARAVRRLPGALYVRA